MKYSALAFIAAVLLGPSAGAQEVRIHSGPYRPPAAAIAVQTDLVELAATVRDRKGMPVGGFQASDFQLLDDDIPQKITFFSEERADSPSAGAAAAVPAASDTAEASGAPAVQRRYLALFFDDTHSAAAAFERSKRAAEKLIGSGLRTGDRVGIFSGSGAVAVDFTNDTKTLLAALAEMKWRPESSMGRGIGACPTLSAYQAYVIAKHLDNRAKQIAIAEILACDPGKPYWTAAVEAQEAGEDDWEHLRNEPSRVLDVLIRVARRLAAEPGARVLLMVSPGFLTDRMEQQMATLVDTCVGNGIAINALDNEGLLSGGANSPESLGQFEGPRTDWADRTLGQRNLIVQGVLVEATESTGGEFIHNNNDLNRGLAALAERPRISYMLGFVPSAAPDNKYHKLKLNLTKPGYEVRARLGYFAAAVKPAETAEQRIAHAAAAADSLTEIPATVTVKAMEDARIAVDIAIDAKGLLFRDESGVSVQQITFVTILENADGNYVDGKEAVMDMRLGPDKRAEMAKDGIKAATSFAAPKGSYRIREVVREAVGNHIAASTTAIEVR